MDKNNAFLIENLKLRLGQETVLDSVSLSMCAGEFVSLKGPSGCGKSTLLMALAGLIEPLSGRITINGMVANDPKIILPPHKRRLNLLFQNLALWPHMTGYEQLKFVWESNRSGDLDKKISFLCGEIGLPENLLNKYPYELSRGQEQRLAIARTFIGNHKIILLDEPLTALDGKLRTKFMEFLGKIKKTAQTTVVMVSHDLMTDTIKYDREYVYDNLSFVAKK